MSIILILLSPDLKIDHVHIRVPNLERPLEFYKSILGFKTVRQEENTIFLSSSNNRDSSKYLVALTEIKDSTTSYIFQRKPRIAGLYHFAILLPFSKTYTKES